MCQAQSGLGVSNLVGLEREKSIEVNARRRGRVIAVARAVFPPQDF